jgi:hypothetical protein
VSRRSGYLLFSHVPKNFAGVLFSRVPKIWASVVFMALAKRCVPYYFTTMDPWTAFQS